MMMVMAMLKKVHLQSGSRKEDVDPQNIVDVCNKFGILRFNPRADGMFKERVSRSDKETINSWLSVVFKLAFKELWSRSVAEERPNLDVRVTNYEVHPEFVNQEAESIVKLAKANGINCPNIPQHLQVDSRYFVQWELFDSSKKEKVDYKNIPECSKLCKDILERGAEVFGEMQVGYQENFGIRMKSYDRAVKHPKDKIDQNGALGKEKGFVPFSHVGVGLCAWDEKRVNKDISDMKQNLLKSSFSWSGNLDLQPSRGTGSALSTVFLGSPVSHSVLKDPETRKQNIEKELKTLRMKMAKTYEYDNENYDNKGFDKIEKIPVPLVAVHDWLAYFGFGEVLSADFVKNKIKTIKVKEALNNMSINVNNVGNEDVREQISGLWFAQKDIEELQTQNKKQSKKIQEAREIMGDTKQILETFEAPSDLTQSSPLRKKKGIIERIVSWLSPSSTK